MQQPIIYGCGGCGPVAYQTKVVLNKAGLNKRREYTRLKRDVWKWEGVSGGLLLSLSVVVTSRQSYAVGERGGRAAEAAAAGQLVMRVFLPNTACPGCTRGLKVHCDDFNCCVPCPCCC